MKINAKCLKCGGDDWKRKDNRILCAICEPRKSGNGAPWPRTYTVSSTGPHEGSSQIRFSDYEGIKKGQRFTVHRERWGYRVVMEKRKGAKK